MKLKIGMTQKIIILVIAMSVFCTLITGLFIYNTEEKNVKANIEESLYNTSELAYNLMDAAINSSIKNYLRAVSDEAYVLVESNYEAYLNGELTEEEAMKRAKDAVSKFSVSDRGYTFVVNSDSVLLVHNELEGEDVSEFDHVKKLVNRKEGYIEYVWKNPTEDIYETKGLYATYFKPWDFIIAASTYKNDFIDLFSVSDFRENLMEVSVGDKGYIFVLDKFGNTIIHPKLEGASFQRLGAIIGFENANEIINKKNGIIEYDYADFPVNRKYEKVMVYKYYEPMGWYVCSSADLNELYASLYQTKKIIISFVGAMILLSIIISIYFSSKFLKPIKSLRDATNVISNGNYNVSIVNYKTDEIGDLTNSFNRMVKKTRKTLEELKLANRKYEEININLEKTVKERTEELTEKNVKLSSEVSIRKRTEKMLVNQNTELEGIKKILEKIAITDALTGISNRHHLNEFLERSWKEAEEYKENITILMIDIDYFKRFNDKYGHVEGDNCLRIVATVMKKSLNYCKDFISRYGGEEFTVVLKNKTKEEIHNIGEKIRTDIENLCIPNEDSTVSNFVTVSIGGYSVNDFQKNSIEESIDRADQALYEAKNSGRNKIMLNLTNI